MRAPSLYNCVVAVAAAAIVALVAADVDAHKAPHPASSQARDRRAAMAAALARKHVLRPHAARAAAVVKSHLVSCDVNANGRKVAELFDKYNLRSLPVVDREKHLVGVVHAEQVIALLRATH